MSQLVLRNVAIRVIIHLMKKNERHSAIIDFIKKSQGISSSEILVFLDGAINRKTLQRDLTCLQNQKLITKSGAGRSVVYSISASNKIQLPVDVEKYFKIPYFDRIVRENFNFAIFEILKNDFFTEEEKEKLNNLQKEFLKNISKYKSQTLINKEFERIMIEFSWKSSAIEGNTYSLLATEILLKENIEEKGKTKEETQMILNHKDAFNEAIQNKERFKKLDYKDIEYLHKTLTKEIGVEANIRKNAVGVTGTKYKPLDNDHQIKEALQKMTDLINEKKSFFEKAFLSLILLSYIQAFEDGNKRTARMVSNAILLSHNSIPLSYRVVDVAEYKKATLLFYEINNIWYFKKIFIKQFEDAVKNYFN